jgi:hypothetical protein
MNKNNALQHFLQISSVATPTRLAHQVMLPLTGLPPTFILIDSAAWSDLKNPQKEKK